MYNIVKSDIIYESRVKCISMLNNYTLHREGQPIVMNYRDKDGDIKCMVAIGVSGGGYSIVSDEKCWKTVKSGTEVEGNDQYSLIRCSSVDFLSLSTKNPHHIYFVSDDGEDGEIYIGDRKFSNRCVWEILE